MPPEDETLPDEPSPETVVTEAADAAEGIVFSHYAKSAVRDLDITVQFEDGQLEIDIYLDAPDDAEAVADDAALAAKAAVDALFQE